MIINRRQPLSRTMKTPRMENKSKEATLYLYDEISWWGIDAKSFVADLNGLDADTINLRIDSPGGDIFSARAIQTALRQHKAKVVAHVDGLAASAASFIMLGADEIEIVDGGFIMVHSAMSFFDILGYFNFADLDQLVVDMQKEQNLLEKVDATIAKDYAKKTGQDIETVMGWLKDETWFTGAEALEVGLVDRVYDGEPVKNNHDLSVFAKAPDSLKCADAIPPKRVAEKALRDAGFSREAAKAFLATKSHDDGSQREAVGPEDETPQREAVAVVEAVEPQIEAIDKTKELLKRISKIRSIET